MLTASQRDIVKATVPLLETGGVALTTHFYGLLLTQHPELKPFFNTANQASGKQARALAASVLLYARHIDDLSTLTAMVERIVNKHVALQVQAEHYPLVGACLLQAIREVLGEQIATDAVIDAWGAAYGQLAQLLIDLEQKSYRANAHRDGGWTGGREFLLERRQQESAEITSFYFRPADGARIADFEPGQYITLRLNVGEKDVRRNYSLSAAPDGRQYRISVKRETGGLVSNFLHDSLQPGDAIEIFPPAGAFTFKTGERPVVFISAGVGITPTLAMLDGALAAGRQVSFIHCARNGDVHAFRDLIESRLDEHPTLSRFYCYSDSDAVNGHAQGFLTAELLASWLPADRDVDAYFLGPTPFMAQTRRSLKALGVPEKQTHYEFFGPPAELV